VTRDAGCVKQLFDTPTVSRTCHRFTPTAKLADIDSSPQPIPQVCVIPFRRKGERIEVCLITSLNKQRWISPKGIVEPGEACEEAALNEAREEAGLHGQVVGKPLGDYEDFKWGSPLRVTVLMMEVTGCDDTWLEADQRERRWVNPELASELISKPVLRRFVHAALGRIVKE
jgi:8-oxo-dGTP pyrophosphatase MutT (NUDIX family)